MRIMVTGGAGFIGSHIVEAARAKGYEVWVIDDLSTGKRENVAEGARLVELDIRDAERVRQVVAEVKPDVISHQAAQTSVSVSHARADPRRRGQRARWAQRRQRCGGRRREAPGLRQHGGAIYGEIPEGERASEDHAKVPLSPYGCGKLAFEGYLPYYAHAHGLQSTVLRYANVYGPRQDPHGEAGVVAIFAQRLRDRQPLQINARAKPGDDGCVRDYVYVKDVVAANLAAIEGKLERGVMNVGTASPPPRVS
jgi:UDP-glucose 4-epimerase